MTARWWETRWFAAVAILLSAVPLLWPPVPPLIDVPAHMARFHVMLGSDAALLDPYYRFVWRPVGYAGVDLIVAALAPLLGLEPTVKLVAILTAMLATAGILWISREAHGRVQPLALFALPLVYNFTFTGGYLNYALATALALNGFALWLRLSRLGKLGWRAAVFVPFASMVWTTHLFGWIILVTLCGSAELARCIGGRRSWPEALVRAAVGGLPLMLPAAMFLLWWPSASSTGSDYFATFAFKPGWLVTALRDRWIVLDIGATAVIAGLIYRGIRSPDWRASRAVGAAALGMLALFLILPFGAANLDSRTAPFLLIAALLAFAPGAQVSPRALAVTAMLGLAFFAARTAATTASFAIESRGWQRHLAAIDHIPRGARVAAFVVNDCPQGWNIARINHLPSFAVVRRGAFTNDQFDLGSTSLLTVIAKGPGRYATDPSQIVTAGRCEAGREIRPLGEALAGLPQGQFDYVWLIRPPAGQPLPAGMTRVWSNGEDALFRLRKTVPLP